MSDVAVNALCWHPRASCVSICSIRPTVGVSMNVTNENCVLNVLGLQQRHKPSTQQRQNVLVYITASDVRLVNTRFCFLYTENAKQRRLLISCLTVNKRPNIFCLPFAKFNKWMGLYLWHWTCIYSPTIRQSCIYTYLLTSL
mgnify:FL=1